MQRPRFVLRFRISPPILHYSALIIFPLARIGMFA